jgi:hypothetical protein
MTCGDGRGLIDGLRRSLLVAETREDSGVLDRSLGEPNSVDILGRRRSSEARRLGIGGVREGDSEPCLSLSFSLLLFREKRFRSPPEPFLD